MQNSQQARKSLMGKHKDGDNKHRVQLSRLSYYMSNIKLKVTKVHL